MSASSDCTTIASTGPVADHVSVTGRMDGRWQCAVQDSHCRILRDGLGHQRLTVHDQRHEAIAAARALGLPLRAQASAREAIQVKALEAGAAVDATSGSVTFSAKAWAVFVHHMTCGLP